MANNVDPVQTVPIEAVCSGSTLFASILNLSVMLGNYLQQTISSDDIFRCIFFLGALRVNLCFFLTKFKNAVTYKRERKGELQRTIRLIYLLASVRSYISGQCIRTKKSPSL